MEYRVKRAMAKKKKETKINLLPKEDFSASTVGRVLAWVLSTFRIIVIVTEILVMLAFLSRFWLDAQNTDLTELIKQKQAVLAASLPFENQFKDTQARLNIFSEFSANEGQAASLISVVSSRLPSDVVLDSIAVSEEGVVFSGVSTNERSIQQLIVNLYEEESIDEVTLQEVSVSEEGQLLKFRISIPKQVNKIE